MKQQPPPAPLRSCSRKQLWGQINVPLLTRKTSAEPENWQVFLSLLFLPCSFPLPLSLQWRLLFYFNLFLRHPRRKCPLFFRHFWRVCTQKHTLLLTLASKLMYFHTVEESREEESKVTWRKWFFSTPHWTVCVITLNTSGEQIKRCWTHCNTH